VDTLANDAAPATPSGLTATALLNAILIEWQHVGAKDLAFYQVYRSITSNPADAVSVGTTRGNFLLWKVHDPNAEYITHYFWVTAIDNANNESAKQGTPVSAVPLRIKPIDLQIESRPWTADFKMWEHTSVYGKLYWSAKDGASDIAVKFADGSTKTITKNLTGTSFAAGIRYFYWDTSSTLQNTTDYATAVGEGKGLLCVVDVQTDKRSSILPFDSYAPTIGSGVIAAGSILTTHIKSSQITTDLLAALSVTSDKIATNAVIADKILASAVTTDKIDALAVTAAKLAANSVVSAKIAAGEVHTGHILFDLLTSDPAYAGGKLWYRSDLDQIRFARGTVLSDVAIIPKYPLSSSTAPPENLVPNQNFEDDRDNDGIADYWTTATFSGTPSFGLSSNSYKGKQSAYISIGSAGGEGKLCSAFIPVVPGQNLVLQVAYAGSIGRTHGYTLAHMEWFDRNQGTMTESDPSDDWRTSTTSFVKKTYMFTVPAGKYYARVALRNYCSAATFEVVYYDDIVLSEMRAAIPTAGVVAAASSTYGSETSVPDVTWTTLFDWTVANVEMESYFINAVVQVRSSVANFWLRVRIYDSTDGKYYPINDVNNTYQVPMQFPALIYSAGTAFFTIPRNVANHHLYLQVLHSIGSSTLFMARYAAWGHSPHMHR